MTEIGNNLAERGEALLLTNVPFPAQCVADESGPISCFHPQIVQLWFTGYIRIQLKGIYFSYSGKNE